MAVLSISFMSPRPFRSLPLLNNMVPSLTFTWIKVANSYRPNPQLWLCPTVASLPNCSLLAIALQGRGAADMLRCRIQRFSSAIGRWRSSISKSWVVVCGWRCR